MQNSYPFRSEVMGNYHGIYTKYIKALGMVNTSHHSDLTRRGLKSDQIVRAQYATKGKNNIQATMMALGAVAEQLQLESVPGFYIDEKTNNWTQSKISGLVIPVRDVEGGITSLLIRNDNPKLNDSGKPANKYVAFSSKGKVKGKNVTQRTHCPIVKGLPKKICGNEVRITEGILKADVATALSDTYCIGIHGLNIQDDLEATLIALEISTVIIALDSGEDSAPDMQRAKGGLIKKCREFGHDVKVEIWDPTLGKGIDDVLKAGHEDKIRYATDEEISEILNTAYENDPWNGEWIYVIDQQKFFHKDKFISYNKKQFADKFRLEKEAAVNSLIASGFEQVHGLTFYPGKDKIAHEDGLLFLNTWYDPKIIPIQGDITPFMDHIRHIFPDQEQRDILLDWMAFNIQHPGEKILWMVVIIGTQGIGKSLIGTALSHMVGTKNVCRPTNEQLHEKFSGWQKDCQLAVVEELMARGRLELMNKLKPIITENTTMIREMNREAYSYPNRLNLLGFTNHDDALCLTKDDRRYCILKSDAGLRAKEDYKNLVGWLKELSNIQALLFFFKMRDLSSFDAKGPAPNTPARRAMIELSRTALQEWVCDRVSNDAWPFNHPIVTARHLAEVLPPGLGKISDRRLIDALKMAGAVHYPQQVTLSDGSRARVWFTGSRKHELLEYSPPEIAKIFEARLEKKSTGFLQNDNNPLLQDDEAYETISKHTRINPIKDRMPM